TLCLSKLLFGKASASIFLIKNSLKHLASWVPPRARPSGHERNSIKKMTNEICRSSRAKPKLAFSIGRCPMLWLFRPYRGCTAMCFSVSLSLPQTTPGYWRFPPCQNPFLTFSGQKPSFLLPALLFFPFLQRRSVRPAHPISV